MGQRGPLLCRCSAAALPLLCQSARSRALTLLVRLAQWVDSTRKNYYAKYSQRATLAVHLFINVVCLPTIVNFDDGANMIDGRSAEEVYNSQAVAATVRGAYTFTHLAVTRWRVLTPTAPCTLPCTAPRQLIAALPPHHPVPCLGSSSPG